MGDKIGSLTVCLFGDGEWEIGLEIVICLLGRRFGDALGQDHRLSTGGIQLHVSVCSV